MHPLRAKAELHGWKSPSLLKICSLADFATSAVPIERMLLDLRGQREGTWEALCTLPWGGFLIDSSLQAPADSRWLSISVESEKINEGDVIEILPALSQVGVRYRRGSNGNVLFATERCNSFCLMCSQPPREVIDDWRVTQLCELIELIDKDEKSLAISGGEPTLLGAGLIQVITHCERILPDTHIHVLSNGRLLGNDGYAQHFSGIHPTLSWGIPLYGDHYGLHDYVVQRTGAFAETIRGLYALNSAAQRIEIRIVLVRPVVERLQELCRFLYRNLPFVEHIALMGMEPIGFAKAHHHSLWIDPADMATSLSYAVEFLARRGLDVSLYNLPLCALPRELWPFCRHSISDWKQHYLPACQSCEIRDRCGGFFAWTTPEWTSQAIKAMTDTGEAVCARH